MSHLTGAPVESFTYTLHHFARAFHRFPWEVRDAVDRGEVDVRDVVRAMQIEAADGRGSRRAHENQLAKMNPKRGPRRGS